MPRLPLPCFGALCGGWSPPIAVDLSSLLLALGAGAAVTAALLNLQIDAKKRLTTEFRAFGANVVVARKTIRYKPNETLDESVAAANILSFGRETA